MTYKFICPKCGCNRIDRVISGVTVTALVEDVDTVESVIVYGNAHVEDFDDQDEVCYECSKCGHPVATGDDQLIRVLKAEKLAREQGLLRYEATIGESINDCAYAFRYYWAEDPKHAEEQARDEIPDGMSFDIVLCKGQE